MKKLLSFALVLAMLFSLAIAIPVSAADATAAENVSKWDGTVPATRYNLQGQGTAADPYLIKDAKDLANLVLITKANITWGKYFSLMCDIDMNGHKWVGIGDATGNASRFEGIFLGNNHVIYNLQVESGENSGFFNITHCASVYDLGIVSGNIDVTYSAAAFHVGGLIGRAMGSATISNCFTNVDINVNNGGSGVVAKTGLLIGNLQTTTSHASKNFNITNCWVNGSITVNCPKKLVNVGGLIGTKGTNPLFVENCTVVCNVKNEAGHADDKFAAFVSDNNANCTVKNSKAELYIETGVMPTVVPGMMGKVWAGTVSATNVTRNITVSVNGQATVNPTPSFDDKCTATTDEVKHTSAMLSGNFAQNGVGDNAKNIRFVSETAFGVNALSETGYVVEFGGKTAKLGGKVVYTSLMANDKVMTPAGKYYVAYGISDIPTTVSGNITVTPYVVLLDGTTVYGASAQYTVTNGALAQNS